VNNRNPNKENTYSNLAAWCEKYHEDSGIKIHPSSVPYDLVIEDLMGQIALLQSHDKQLVNWIDFTNPRLANFEARINAIKEQLEKLEDSLLNKADKVVKENKKVNK
jgi:hypothetical protein